MSLDHARIQYKYLSLYEIGYFLGGRYKSRYDPRRNSRRAVSGRAGVDNGVDVGPAISPTLDLSSRKDPGHLMYLGVGKLRTKTDYTLTD